jgi:hypothetical protein
MRETSDLVGIYGAVDVAVAGDLDRRAAVAQLLPAYKDPNFHWFAEFDQWVREKRAATESDTPPFPSLEDALDHLAERPEPTPRMQARRLFAIALATRSHPEMQDPDNDLAQLALRAIPVDPDAADFDDASRQVLKILGDQERLAPAEEQTEGALSDWWDVTVQALEGFVPDPHGMGPKPCSGKLLKVGGLPAASLETYFETDKITFDRATSFLDPSNWPRCSDFWCDMDKTTPLPLGGQRYHEVVSTNCDNQDVGWTIEANLDFGFRQQQGVMAAAEYGMSPGMPNPYVAVDEGMLMVEQIGVGGGVAGADKLRVTTTKRVRFNGPFSGEQLAVIMCATGYAAVAEDFVFNCAALGAEGTPFPQDGAAKVGTGAPAGPPLPVKAFADEAAAALKACVDDCADAYEDAQRKIAAGTYSADDLVRDMANMWTRVLRDSAKGVDIAVRGVQNRPGDRAQETD